MKWENLLIGWTTDENAMIFWDKISHAHSPIRPLSFDFMLVAHAHANHMCVSSFIAFMQITLWISTLTLTSSSSTDTRMSLLHQIIYHVCMAATVSLHNVCHNRCINKFERCTFFSNHIICVCCNKFTCSTLGLRWMLHVTIPLTEVRACAILPVASSCKCALLTLIDTVAVRQILFTFNTQTLFTVCQTVKCVVHVLNFRWQTINEIDYWCSMMVRCSTSSFAIAHQSNICLKHFRHHETSDFHWTLH